MCSRDCGRSCVELVGGADEAATLGMQRIGLFQDCSATLPQIVDARLWRGPNPCVRASKPIQIKGVHPLQLPRDRSEDNGSLAQTGGGWRSCHLTSTGHGENPKSAIFFEIASRALTVRAGGPPDDEEVGWLGR